jgi:hypothetical protein
MSLSKLVALVPPPTNPVDAGTYGEWSGVEEELGIVLPEDYKLLVNTYGIGWFANWIGILSPFSERLPLIHPGRLSLMAPNAEHPRYYHPFQIFPKPGGPLPWGQDDNAGLFCWLTEGAPEQWPTINLDSHYSAEYRRVDLTATGLLFGWLSGDLTGDWYPEDVIPTQEQVFTPGYLPDY